MPPSSDTAPAPAGGGSNQQSQSTCPTVAAKEEMYAALVKSLTAVYAKHCEVHIASSIAPEAPQVMADEKPPGPPENALLLASILAPPQTPKGDGAIQAMATLFSYDVTVPAKSAIRVALPTVCLERNLPPPALDQSFSGKVTPVETASPGFLSNPAVAKNLEVAVIGSGGTHSLTLQLENKSPNPIGVTIPAGTTVTFSDSTAILDPPNLLRALVLTQGAVASVAQTHAAAEPESLFSKKPKVAVQHLLQLSVWSAAEKLDGERTKELVTDFYFRQLEPLLGPEKAKDAAKKLCYEVALVVERVKNVMEETVTDPPPDPHVIDLLAVGVKPWFSE